MKLLAVDSSGLVASVALLDGGVLLAEYTMNYKKTHSQTLLPMVEEIRRMTDLDLNSLDAIAIAAGPGSFTGLRIGSATVKGLAMTLNIPIVPVPTVDALAYNLWGSSGIVCPLMDARREQVYTGLYRFNEGELEIVKAQCALGIDELTGILNELGEPVTFLGDGVPVHKEYLEANLRIKPSFAPPHRNYQSAGSVALLGQRMYDEGHYDSAMQHRPIYLRVSQAERERNDMVLIRPMEERDLEQVAALEEETFSMPWSIDAFREMVFCEDASFLVAEDRGKICGTAGLRNVSGDGEITNVVIREEYRGSGLGTKLMERLLSAGAELGCTAYTLEVRVSNEPAIALYEKMGFISEGIRPKFYEKPEEDANIMWKR